MTPHCPSDLALELFLIQPERSPEAPHLESCPTCAARLARMREEGEEFRRVVFPKTIEAVERAMDRSWFGDLAWFRDRAWLRGWRIAFAPAGALAAVAAAFLFMHAQGPDDEYEYGVKGSGMTLAVFANGVSEHCAVKDGAGVAAADTLWFKVQPAADCWLWIMSVDAKGEVSRLYPPQGVAPDRRRTGPVPVGAKLDGVPGPERIYAVCAPSQATDFAEVKAAAAAAMGGADNVRKARMLGGSLSRALQSSLLIEKRDAEKRP
ncbi:MAG TPA: DUF4384 domain-containing protein [Anaeromyxobacter sp.]